MKLEPFKTGRDIKKPFLSGRWVWMLAAFAWLITFVVAYSDCSIQQIVRMQCTGWSLGTFNSVDTEKIAAMKGQFGDVFGLLNGAFGAVTLWLVYLAYSREASSSEAQMDFVRRERYLAEIDASIQAYNRQLHDIVVLESQGENRQQTWTSKHGLMTLWTSRLTRPVQIDPRGFLIAIETPGLSPQDKRAKQSVWSPINEHIEGYPTERKPLAPEFKNSKWVAQMLADSDKETAASFANAVREKWLVVYSEYRYQLDALFRTWYHTCKAVEQARALGIDAETEWRAAARWRSQLSWIELLFLLANQSLSEGDSGDGFPRAVELSSRYAMFDNFVAGLDPTVHAVLQVARGDIEIPGGRALPKECFSSEAAKNKNKSDARNGLIA